MIDAQGKRRVIKVLGDRKPEVLDECEEAVHAVTSLSSHATTLAETRRRWGNKPARSSRQTVERNRPVSSRTLGRRITIAALLLPMQIASLDRQARVLYSGSSRRIAVGRFPLSVSTARPNVWSRLPWWSEAFDLRAADSRAKHVGDGPDRGREEITATGGNDPLSVDGHADRRRSVGEINEALAISVRLVLADHRIMAAEIGLERRVRPPTDEELELILDRGLISRRRSDRAPASTAWPTALLRRSPVGRTRCRVAGPCAAACRRSYPSRSCYRAGSLYECVRSVGTRDRAHRPWLADEHRPGTQESE